jgi:hypothetical protein
LANVDQEKALAASLIVFAMILSVSLLGVIVYIFYRPKKGLVIIPVSDNFDGIGSPSDPLHSPSIK